MGTLPLNFIYLLYCVRSIGKSVDFVLEDILIDYPLRAELAPTSLHRLIVPKKGGSRR